MLREKIFTKQLEDAGITIGETDIWQNIITAPSVASNPQFLNEAGFFDENKFKLFLKNAQESQDQSAWLAWKGYMNQLGANLKNQTYTNLINAALGASLKEGEFQHKEDNTLISGDFVYIPYTSVPDSLINISKSDIEAYVKSHASEFKVEATRDITYVKFDIAATSEDREDIKNVVGSFLEDKKEYSKVTKSEIVVPGLKNATDYETFFQENNSDLAFNESYFMIDQLPEEVAKEAFDKKVNDTFGPYASGGYSKISKITEVVQRPDSIKSSHIIIPYISSQNANASKTEEQAKKSADSIYRLVRNNKTKFAEIADEINVDRSKGKGGDIGWITQSQAFSPVFFGDNFANFIYENKKGKVGVVKTDFGYHVIRVDDQTKSVKSLRLVTFGRQIEPSQNTEDGVFQEAEKFALEISKGDKDFAAIAQEKKYTPRSGVGLRVLGENVPGLPGTNRQIITWSYENDVEVGDFKRFDVDKGYVVAVLTGKTNAGLLSAVKANGSVRPILINRRKAKILQDKMNGASLNDIAVANNVTVRKVSDVALKSPSITGVGNEPKVVGAMYYAKENQLYNKIEGSKGVFAFVVSKKELPTALPNYESTRQRISETRKNSGYNLMYNALKKASNVEDNRGVFYGVQQ